MGELQFFDLGCLMITFDKTETNGWDISGVMKIISIKEAMI